MSVVMPAMREAQRAGWHALLDVHAAHPTGWALIGGQMVHVWCAERGRSPMRPTDDLDAVLDVRGEPGNPGVLMTFTAVLDRLGFAPAGTSPNGHQTEPARRPRREGGRVHRHVGHRSDPAHRRLPRADDADRAR